MTDKKLDKFEEKAREIVDKWVKSAPGDDPLIDDIAQALREASEGSSVKSETKELSNTNNASEPQVVSEEEISVLSRDAFIEHNGSWDTKLDDRFSKMFAMARHTFFVGYGMGFRKAASMNAIARIEWPSEEQVRDYFQWSKDVKVTTPLQAFQVLEWLKKFMGNEQGGG